MTIFPKAVTEGHLTILLISLTEVLLFCNYHDCDQKTTLLMEMVTVRTAKNALLLVKDSGRRLKLTQRFVAFFPKVRS